MNYIDQIVNYVIRPARDIYRPKRLGNNNFFINASMETNSPISVQREDRVILNKQNQSIQVSYYECDCAKNNNRTDQEGLSTYHSNIFQYKNNHLVDKFNARNKQKNCVIYLHANNGSRIEGMTYLKKLLQAKLNVCLFDCSGSGISQGQFVTLGIKQSKDLQCVINFLIKEKQITQIALWGRSMGASTALIYGSKANNCVKSLILDSPFKDLQKLIKQIASDRTGLPKIFFNPIIPFIRNQIRNRTGYSIQELKMKKYLISSKQSKQKTGSNFDKNKNPLENIPALFLVSKNDKLVKVHHGQKLFKRYPCSDKLLEYIQNQHHESRKAEIIDKCIHFILRCFRNDELKTMTQNYSSKKTFTSEMPILNFRSEKTRQAHGFRQSGQNQFNHDERILFRKENSEQNLQAQQNQISQQQFFHKMKHGIKNLCGSQYYEQSLSQRKMLRNSSSMSDLINQSNQNKIQPIKLSFFKKNKIKTSFVQRSQPRIDNLMKNSITPQKPPVNQYLSRQKQKQRQTDVVIESPQLQSQSRFKKISMSRQGSKSKDFNLLNKTTIIPENRFFQLKNFRSVNTPTSIQNPNQNSNQNFYPPKKQFYTDRNDNNSDRISAIKTQNFLPQTSTTPCSMKVIQFKSNQNIKKKISLSTTLQNIQVPNLTNNSQSANHFSEDMYYKNYQTTMNSFSPKRFFYEKR